MTKFLISSKNFPSQFFYFLRKILWKTRYTLGFKRYTIHFIEIINEY